MGREKRIAESRAKEILEKTQSSAGSRASSPAPSASAPAPAPAPVVADTGVTSTGKAIVEIIALYLVPVALMLIVGKLLLHL